jgi:hypothetical protein
LFSLEIFFERGYATLNGLKTNSGSYGNEILTISGSKNKNEYTETSEIKYYYHKNNSFENEVNYFFDCINCNLDIKIGNIDNAKKIMKLIGRIYGTII